MPDSSGTSARPFLLKLRPSRWLLAWWLSLHLVLVAAASLAHLPTEVAAALVFLVGLHAWLRYPVPSTLLVVSPGSRIALPAEGRFDLTPSSATRVGRFWIELRFSSRKGARRLLIRDQFTDSDWRRLNIALREWL